MKTFLFLLLMLSLLSAPCALAQDSAPKLLYQGHGSLRIVTADNHVIYVDPYAGEGYDLPADLILVSHAHPDHGAVSLITRRAGDCQVITFAEALQDGVHQTFDLGYAVVEAVEAGNNRNHDIRSCVGWLITLPGGISVYATGDTSTTDQMTALSSRDIHYEFFVCDGVFNMDVQEASACARRVGARHSIPYHMAPGALFSQEVADAFDGPGKLVLAAGEELALE